MHSLSRTLVLGTTLLTAMVFVAAGLVLYLLVRMSLFSELDRSLVDRAGLLAATIEVEDGKLDLELIDLDMRSFEGRESDVYVQVWSAAGATLYKSSSLAAADLENRGTLPESAEFFSTTLPDGRRARAVCLTFAPRAEDLEADGEWRPGAAEAMATAATAELNTVSLMLAQSTSSIKGTLARLRLLLLLVGGVAVAVAGSALSAYVARSLLPLNELAHEIGQVGEDDLNQPIDGIGCPSEIRPVIDRLNQLLARLDGAFQRERSMNANVAHELRNPLAGLRLKMEVAASRSREPGEYRQTLGECRQILSQMERMVDNLLSLSRLDAGQFRLSVHAVPLRDLIDAPWHALATEAEKRRLRVQWRLDPELTVVTDSALLGIAIRNVLDNAVSYAEEGGAVSVMTKAADNGVEILVTNTGSRLTEADARDALIPFWQHDPSRSKTGIHCGLGLSLVQRVVAALGGQLSVRSEPGGEFEIAIVLPQVVESR